MAGLDALPFEATKPAHLTAAVTEWQRTGHALPAPLDIWDDVEKWIRVPHPQNGLAFLRVTGRLDQAASIWPWLERQRQYSAELRAMASAAIDSCMPEKHRPKLFWSAPDA